MTLPTDEGLSDAYDTAHDRHIMMYRKGSESEAHYKGIAAVRTAILDALITEAEAQEGELELWPSTIQDDDGSPLYDAKDMKTIRLSDWLRSMKDGE